jgi:hypothetical protein
MDALGLALLGAMFASIAAAVGGFAALRAPPTDPTTLCRTDRPLRAYTLILVDSTDHLAPRHKKRLAAIVRQERARLSAYDRLTILSLRPENPHEPRQLFSLCLPRDPRLANPLFENPQRVQQRWDDRVGKALAAATRRAGGGGAGRTSPIVEALDAAVADPDFVAAAQRRLVLVSDLLEHDPQGFSLYHDGAALAGFLASRPDAVPDLSGVSVRIAAIDRPEAVVRQAAARRDFWAPFFAASHARAVAWDPTG